MTDAHGNTVALPIQGNGHIECSDGTRCAIYIDDKGNQYARADLYPLKWFVKIHGGSYKKI